MKLTAYKIYEQGDMWITPATAARQWMADTSQGYARRCLPLKIANQAGWFILNKVPFRAYWNGGKSNDAIVIKTLEPAEVLHNVCSHFGSGILTFNIPYVFRTEKGYNLQVRGPANWPILNAYPLEGIVETDWSPATFTMNYQLREAHIATFRRREPICMIVPQKRGELEAFNPEIKNLSDDPQMALRHHTWAKSRRDFLDDLEAGDTLATKEGWQRDYMKGLDDGKKVGEHQTKLELQPFV